MKTLMKKEKVLTLLAVLFLNVQAFAQTMQDVADKVGNQMGAVKTIIEWVIGIGMFLGLANAIFKVAMKKHEGYDGIIGWGVGLVIYVVGVMVLNAWGILGE